jgi:hypothetical protein
LVGRVHLDVSDAYNAFMEDHSPIKALYDVTGYRIETGVFEMEVPMTYERFDEFLSNNWHHSRSIMCCLASLR